MSESRRFHLLLPAELEAQARAFGRGAGLGLSAAIRLLVARGLQAKLAGSSREPALLATLAAAEHAVLMVASILPEGERRRRELGQQASVAAEERLALFASEAE